MNTGRTCEKCGGLFQAILPDRADDEQQLAKLLEQGRKIDFIKVLRQKTGCDLKDAKGTLEHVVRTKRQCHRCGAELGAGRIVDCPKCNSMNIVLRLETDGATK